MATSRARRIGSAVGALLLAVPLAPVGPFVAPAMAATTALGSGECAQQVSAAGTLTGAVTVEGDDCLVAFKGGSGTWVVPEAITALEYLVVGGGGGGGSRGGGGAGAFFETTAAVSATPGASIAVAVGVGGAAGTAGNTTTLVAASPGANGTASVFDGVTAYGGGGGTSTRQYDPDAGRNALPDPPEGTDLTARPVFAADFTAGAGGSEGGSGGGGQASPEHNWFTPTDGNSVTQITDLGSRGGAGRPAGTAGAGLSRNGGGDSLSIFHLFADGRVRSFWIGAGGGGAGARGGDVVWASSGETIEGVVASDGQIIDLEGPGFVPGAGGAGKASTLLSDTSATALGIGQVAGGAVHFAGGGAGTANYHNPAEGVEPNVRVETLLTVRVLTGFQGVGGGGGGGATAAGAPNTGGGGRGGAAGGSGVVLVRYTRVAQAPFALTPTSFTEDEPVTLDLTGGSGSGELTITRDDATEPCTLSGTTLTATASTGTCTITVTRTADASYLARTDTFVITIGQVVPEDPGPEDTLPEDVSTDEQQGNAARVPQLTCSPDPVVASGLVTCTVRGADADIDILWTAAADGTPFTSQPVRTGPDGSGTFSFIVPGDASGSTVSVELVGWTARLDLGVAVLGARVDGAASRIPSRVNTGGGPVPLVPLTLVLLVAAMATTLGTIDRGREAVSVVAASQRAHQVRAARVRRLPEFDALELRLAALRDGLHRQS